MRPLSRAKWRTVVSKAPPATRTPAAAGPASRPQFSGCRRCVRVCRPTSGDDITRPAG